MCLEDLLLQKAKLKSPNASENSNLEAFKVNSSERSLHVEIGAYFSAPSQETENVFFLFLLGRVTSIF